MGHDAKVLLYALGILLALELGLQLANVVRVEARPGLGLEGDPVCLLLGTSRTRRGLVPEVVEEVLEARGAPEPWVGSVSRMGATTAGLHALYREAIRPLRIEGPRILGIEVRGAGLNDRYLVPREEAELASAEPRGLWSRLRASGGAGLARHLLRKLALARLRERGLGGLPGGEGGEPERSRTLLGWERATKGWVPFRSAPPPDLDVRRTGRKYRSRLLRGYRLGGVQTRQLRALLDAAREDGFRPVLYHLPVTEAHRSFYAPGAYRAFLEHVGRVAEREGVALVDLDAGHGLPRTAFHDTHHLRPEAARRFSRRFAEAVVLPLAASGSGGAGGASEP